MVAGDDDDVVVVVVVVVPVSSGLLVLPAPPMGGKIAFRSGPHKAMLLWSS